MATDLRGKTLAELKGALRQEIEELAEFADYEIVDSERTDDGPRPNEKWPNDGRDDEEGGAEDRSGKSP